LFRERLDAVGGLFMAGSWTSMGGFQPTYMAGEATARAVLKKMKARKQASESSDELLGEPANV
jgi:prolycopene isomerase